MKYIIFLLLFTFVYPQSIILTPQEKEILKTHPLRCISTGLWAPFNLYENDKLVGIGFDYWNLIREKLGIKNECKKAENWKQVLSEIQNKTSDLTIASQETLERLKYAVFSKPYVKYPLVIATKNTVGFIHNIELVKDKVIAMPRAYATTSLLLENHSYLNIEYTDSIDKALSLVEEGKAFATIDILPVIAYKINENNFDTLKISGSIPEYFSVSIMLRKDYAILLPLINKAIDSIRQKEKNKIHEKWIMLHDDPKIPSTYFYILLFGSFFVFSLFGRWAFLLKKEIVKKNKREEELKKLVNIDSLTGIFNRHMLDKTLEYNIALAQRYGAPLSVIFFDIDQFKKINDTHGHEFGDYVLKEIAKYVQKNIRKTDIFGRWGGDEFLIIILEAEENNTAEFAKNIDNLIRKHTFKNNVNVTCSFGVSSYKDEDTLQSIMSRVDTRFYESKKEGKKEGNKDTDET